MNIQYDKTFLKYTLDILGEQLEDLETWSVYNEDKNLDKIIEFKNAFNVLKRIVKK